MSSSGHVAVWELFLQRFGCQTAHYHYLFSEYFLFDLIHIGILEHFVHGATSIVIVLFFFKRWIFLIENLKRCWWIVFKIIGLTFLADCMTVPFFLARNAFGTSWFPLGFGFMITAVVLYSLRSVPHSSPASWNWRMALVLGAVQGVAFLPGVSRLAVTYAAGRWLRLPPHKALEISLLIQWPLITVAFLNSLRILSVQSNSLMLLDGTLLLVMVSASVLAYCALAWFKTLVDAGKVWLFSLYMLVPIVAWMVLVVF